MQSKKYSLSREDLKKWAQNTLIFSSPFMIIFLTALKGGVDWKVALGAAYITALGSLIDLLRKYSAGTVTITKPVETTGTSITSTVIPTAPINTDYIGGSMATL